MFQFAKESLEVTHRCHVVKNVHQILFSPLLEAENRNYTVGVTGSSYSKEP